ncbi:zonadhesin-like [Poecilia reticulata]|uniref:zonadhesin-like n=1 Tax=Poecilia reticulata TaxID=8081 RepID=UPI0004A4E486|nr:PREDICTED: zonadhesin-like [Poecilia reticulata]
MYGSDTLNELKVLSKTSGGESEVWKKTGFQSSAWLGDSITVSKASSESVTIVFEARRGVSSSCDSALDNIVITEGECPACDSECDFDTAGDLCGWTVHNDNPEVFGFTQYTGPTETEGTGPEDDFSKPGFGEYMLLDSFEAIAGESSQLRSPVIPSTSGCLELSFHYYLYGTSTTMEISVHAITGGSLGNPLFTVKGNQGQGWKPAEVRLEGTGNIQFAIVGKYGETPLTDVAVDAVCIKSCTGKKALSLPSFLCNQKPNTTIPGCDQEEEDLYESSGYCGILLDKNGPFAACHPKVNPNNYFRDCVFDLCELDGARPILCEAIEAYVTECQDRGVTIGPWRNESFCRDVLWKTFLLWRTVL